MQQVLCHPPPSGMTWGELLSKQVAVKLNSWSPAKEDKASPSQTPTKKSPAFLRVPLIRQLKSHACVSHYSQKLPCLDGGYILSQGHNLKLWAVNKGPRQGHLPFSLPSNTPPPLTLNTHKHWLHQQYPFMFQFH